MTQFEKKAKRYSTSSNFFDKHAKVDDPYADKRDSIYTSAKNNRYSLNVNTHKPYDTIQV